MSFETLLLRFYILLMHFETLLMRFYILLMSFETLLMRFYILLMSFETLLMHFETLLMSFYILFFKIHTPISRPELITTKTSRTTKNKGKPPQFLAHLLLSQHTIHPNKSKRARKPTHRNPTSHIRQTKLGQPYPKDGTTYNKNCG